MAKMDLREYVLNIREFDLSLPWERFKRLKANCETVRPDMQRKMVEYRKDIDAQFDLFLRTVRAGEFLYLAQ